MTNNPVAGVPSLHSISNPIMTKKEDVAAYLIQFLFANPGGTSSLNEGEMMSFRKLVAKHGAKDPNVLADAIGSMLTESIRHYFPDDGILATCQIEEVNGYDDNGRLLGTFGITIAIRDKNGTPVIPLSKLNVAKDGKSFKMVA